MEKRIFLASPHMSDEEKIAKVRFWATQAREKAHHYERKEIGYNYRMSNRLFCIDNIVIIV